MKKRIKKKVVTIVAYLAGYDSKVREEEQLTLEDVSEKEAKKKIKEARAKLRDRLVKDFGGSWGSKVTMGVRTGQQVKVKSYTKKVVIRGKDYGNKVVKSTRKTFQKWTRLQEKKVILLRQQGRSYKQISRSLDRPYESVRTKILRLQGIKKT